MANQTSPGIDQPLADLDKAFADVKQPAVGSEQPPTGPEQRKHQRKIFRTTAQIRTPSGEILHVQTLDISEGGISVIASVNPKQKAVCVVQLNIPTKPRGHITAEIKAIVVHSIYNSSEAGFKIGLQFGKLSPEVFEAITKFVVT